MTPCTCNREMGDHCPACAPGVVSGVDRAGWPVLVKVDHNVYGYSKTPGSSMTVLMDGMVEPGRWLAWPLNGGPALPGSFATPEQGAYAIGARLPDEPPAIVPAKVDDRWGDLSSEQRAGAPTPSEAADIERESAHRAIAAIVRLGHTEHCAKRLAWGDRECECDGVADVADLRAYLAQTQKQRAYWKQQCEEARMVANSRTQSPTLANALALLDIAAEKNPPLVHLAALIRLGL